MAYLNLADIQGFILQGYNMSAVRHFILKFNAAESARHFIHDIVSGEDPDIPQITTATPWESKPSYCLNIGFTYQGLTALGLPDSSLQSFAPSAAFVEGAVARAKILGDTAENAPHNWDSCFGTQKPEVLLSLFVTDQEAQKGQEAKEWMAVLEEKDKILRVFLSQYAISILNTYDGAALEEGKVHFGFKDGISQPWIDGAPTPKNPNRSASHRVPTGEFLLGYPSRWKDFCYAVPQPEVLGINGSFAAFRVLKQDVVAFEDYLQEIAPKLFMGPDKLAAKMCGRWRNGAPLVLSPDHQDPLYESEKGKNLNSFDYQDDPNGYKCPFGAHIRRTNPRKDPSERRIIRRGMPYGSPYDPENPKSRDEERGLLGLFICASLEDQFEFLMRQWINRGGFNGVLPAYAKDPLIGSNAKDESMFIIPAENGDKKAEGFSQFVTTKGSLYCFLPSISALKHIANM